MNDHVQRCRRMLAEQVETLGTFRNASPRDPGFKQWRQNTLTTLQRVWPGDTTRSERFRRITFSPSSGKPDGKTLREWYTRGCAEATAFLEALIATVDREGVPPPPAANTDAPPSLPPQADDFPVLDLPKTGDAPLVLSQGDSLADAAAMPGTDGREAGSPAPPQLKVNVKAPVARSEAPPSVSMQRPAELRVEHADAIRPEPRDAAAGPARLPNEPRVPAKADERAIEKTPAKPALPAPPAAATPATPAAPAAARAARPRKAAPKAKLKDLLGLNALEAAAGAAAKELRAAAPRPARPAPPAPPAAPAPPVSSQAPAPPPAPAPDLPEMDDAAAARATEDFMRSSPVLGLTGKPVQRTTDDTGFSDPDAIGVATLAHDAGRLGVGEDRRDAVRSELMELAVQFEAHTPQWATLQRAVTLSMEYPELAKRLMPIVLPWLGRAA